MVKAENTIVGIYGYKGSGKTVTLMLFLYIEAIIKQVEKVFSNIEILNSDIKWDWLKGEDMIELSSKLQNSVIGIDELHEYADSRNSGTLQNKRVCDFFLQSRHTQSDIYYSTQFKDQIDKRIRRITDIEIVCENCFIDLDHDGDDDLFKLTVINRTYGLPPRELKFYASPIFQMYDSTQRINPFIFTKKEEKVWIDKHGKEK